MDDIYILDTFKTVFVWVGPESNEEEKQCSFEMALAYVKEASKLDGRSIDTPVVSTIAGFEPKTCILIFFDFFFIFDFFMFFFFDVYSYYLVP